MRDFCKPLIPLNGCKGTKFLPFLQVFSAFYCNFHKKTLFPLFQRDVSFFIIPKSPTPHQNAPKPFVYAGFRW